MAIKKVQGDLDFEQSSKILNAMMDPRASDPSTPVPGQVWFNTTSDRLKHYDGSIISTVMHLAANDTVTGVFHFSPASGAVPFTVDGGANSVVTNLNADKVDGFNAAQIATGSTVAVRRSDGTLVVADPDNDNEAATKGYVDRSRQDRDKKDECHVATTANVDLSSMPAAIDGRTMSVDERFLAKNQTDASENGIYLFKGAASAAVRAPDADEDSEVTAGMTTYIVFGTDHQGAIFTLNTPDPITVGTTDLSFVQTGGQSIYDAGNGMVKSGSRFHFIQDTDYTPGSIVYADGATTMTFLAPAVVGKVLKSGTNPSWAAIDLTADVGTSVLPVGNGGTGTSDQFDQGGVVFAGSNGVYDSDDVFFWNNTSKRLGLGTSSPGGRLHVATGSTGATASTSADELIVECGASGGVSILAPDSSEAQIRLGSPSNNTMALWTSQESIDLVQFGTGSASGKLQLLSGFGEVAATFHSDQSLTLGTTSAPSGSSRFWLYEPTGLASMLIGSGDGQGAGITLDGRANGDGSGGDYSTISHQSDGDLRITNNGAYSIEFVTNSKNVGRFTDDGFLSVGRHGGTWPLDVYSASENNIGRFEHAGNGSEGAHVQIYHSSSSPAVDDVTGSFQFASKDSTGGENVQARIRSVVRQVGTSFVDADLILSCYESDSEVDVLSITHDGRVSVGSTTPTRGIFEVHNPDTGNEPPVFITATSTGDAAITFNISGVTNWTVGIDNSDSDKFKIDSGSVLTTSPAVVISTSNDVGIGTNAPLYRLDVRDDFAGDNLVGRFCNADASGGTSIQIDRTGDNRASSIQFSTEGTPDWHLGILRWGGSTTSRFAISSVSDMNTTEPQFAISGNYVGIGTYNPQQRLYIKGDSNITTAVAFENTVSSNKWRMHAHYADQTLRFRAGTFTTDLMVLDDSGNLSVGGASLNYKLSVLGDIGIVNGSSSRYALRHSQFGYSSNYRTLLIGSESTTFGTNITGATTICMGVDVSGNTNGSFSGDGREIVFRNNATFISPNSADDAYLTVLRFDGSGGLRLGSTNDVAVNAGDLGVGTLTPGGKLHVVGGTTSGDTLMKIGDRITVTGDGEFTFGSAAAHGKISWDSGKAIFGSIGSNDIEIQTGSVSRLSINSSDGAVKIGSGGSFYRLTVAASTAFVATGTMLVSAALNGSGEGLFVDCKTRTPADEAFAALGVRDRAGNYPFRVKVGGNVELGNLTADKALFLDSNKNIVSNGTTDLIDEGSTNLYHTTSRAQSAISSASSLEISYSSGSIGLGTEAGRVKSATIGDGVATEHVFTHNLGTRAVNTTVFRTASPYDEVDVPIEHTTTNSVTVKPNHVYTSGEYTIVCSAANG